MNIIDAYNLGLFTENELISAYDCSALQLRELTGQAGDLSLRCKKELHREYQRGIVDCTKEQCLVYAEKYKSTPSTIRRCLLGEFEQSERHSLAESVAELLAKKLPQAEIAKQLGISQPQVSKLNPNPLRKPRGRKMTEELWCELLSQYPRFSITELAKMYGISRASIYARLPK